MQFWKHFNGIDFLHIAHTNIRFSQPELCVVGDISKGSKNNEKYEKYKRNDDVKPCFQRWKILRILGHRIIIIFKLQSEFVQKNFVQSRSICEIKGILFLKKPSHVKPMDGNNHHQLDWYFYCIIRLNDEPVGFKLYASIYRDVTTLCDVKTTTYSNI